MTEIYSGIYALKYYKFHNCPRVLGHILFWASYIILDICAIVSFASVRLFVKPQVCKDFFY